MCSLSNHDDDDDDNDTSDGKMIERRCDMMPGNKI